ncbi:MAG: thioesterase family protein [Acidimicrobiia bacterium]|nr:thioesterase family protein [Acidimicrobiia bacterium]
MFEFDEALALEPAGPTKWTATIPDGWDFAGIPNGGLVMALLAKALGPATGHPDPITVTVHFAAPASPGPAEIHGEVLRSGRRFGTAGGRLIQNGRVVAHALATFGDLVGNDDGPTYESGLPELPPIDRCIAGLDASEVFVPQIFDKVEIRFHPDHLGFATGEKHGQPDLAGWMRLRDGRSPDLLSILLFADAHPPSVFNAPGITFGWVPTIELTVHVHKRPVNGWIGGWFSTEHINRGLLEEDGILWDESGELVAVARQIAVIPRT